MFVEFYVRAAGRRPDHAQDRPDLHRARRRLRRADALVGLQSRPAVVAQARDRHRCLLLVPDPARRALRAHRPDGDGRRLFLQHSRRRGADQILRRRLRPARRYAAVGAGAHLPGRLGFPALLVPSRSIMARRLVEIPRGPPFIRRARLDLGGAVSSGQYPARHRAGRRRAAACRHFAECDAVGRAVHHRLVRLRACQSELDAGAVQIRDRRPGFPPLASHRGRSRRLEQFRRHVPDLGPSVRHLLHAGERTAGRLWHRRQELPGELRRASCSIRSGSETPASLHFIHQFAVNSCCGSAARCGGLVVV